MNWAHLIGWICVCPLLALILTALMANDKGGSENAYAIFAGMLLMAATGIMLLCGAFR